MFDGLYFEFPYLIFIVLIFIACAMLCKMKLPSIYFPHTGSFLKSSVSVSKTLFILKWLGIIMMILVQASYHLYDLII